MLSPIIFSILIGLLSLAALVLWIFALIDCLRQPWETGKKVIWILVLIFVQGLGALIYFGVQKKWKYFVVYLVTVGLIIPLILIGVASSSVDSARQQAREAKREEGVQQLVEEVPEQISKNQTANWKTYKDEEYGYEIKYPPGWHVLEDSDPSPLRYEPLGVYSVEKGVGLVSPGSPSVSIEISPEFSSLEEWINIEKKVSRALKIMVDSFQKEIMVDGERGWREVTIKDDAITSAKAGFFENGRLYYIEWNDYTGIDPKSLKVFNQTLSTLKFLNFKEED